MVYKQISLDITPAQMRKAAAGKQITLAGGQLCGGSMKTYLHPANVDKIMKAKKAGRGARIFIAPGAINHDLEAMKAGSIWAWVKEKAFPWVKQHLLPALKPVLSPLVDQGAQMLGSMTGQPALVNILRGEVRNLTGVGVAKGKGSQAMKDRMSKIRAMKKPKGSHGSFKLSPAGSFKLT